MAPRWRKYQSALRYQEARRKSIFRIPIYILILCLVILCVKGVFRLLDLSLDFSNTGQNSAAHLQVERIDRNVLRQILDPNKFFNIEDNSVSVQAGAKRVEVITSIIPYLQRTIIDALDRKYSQNIGFAAMDPDTGRILAMAGYNRDNPKTNTCVEAVFPAASLFKIITAAAAIETCGFSPDTRLCFNGGKYTLYKSQLTDRKNRYTNWTTLNDAFADSINPVFGKIGEKKLKKDIIERYAALFGFGHKIGADIRIEPSVFSINDKPYNWAEVACGFNKTTRISPIHGAMIASIIAENGMRVTPSLVDMVTYKNRVIYRRPPPVKKRVISSITAFSIKKLMHATIAEGTAKKLFKGYRSNPVLSHLEICGKTGSINNNPEQIRFDWFIGFAKDKKTGKKFVAGVIVAHKKYIGTRAAQYFKKAVTAYFSKNRK